MAVSRLTTVRWGILGVGDVCEVKAGPAFQKAQGSELVAVMRRTASKAEDFAKRHGVPRWYTDADELLSDPEVNAVYIATPPRSHLVSARTIIMCFRVRSSLHQRQIADSTNHSLH